MNLPKLAWRFLWGRPLITALTLAGVALGAALVSAVLTVRAESERAVLADDPLHDLVVGAKGSPLQLILSSIHHIDVPTGNIPYSRYEALRDDRRVRSAVPIGLGDNYEGLRIVGTERSYFERTPRGENAAAVHRVAEGRMFEEDFEAVLGARAAAETGLRIGDSFYGTHGLVAIRGSEVHDDFPYEVVGILGRTNGPDDRAIFTTLESVWVVHDAEEEAHGRAPGGRAPGSFLEGFDTVYERRDREVTAVLVQLNSPGFRIIMQREINDNTESMAAVPINEMLRLYRMVLEPMHRVLLIVAWLVVAVAALSVLATLYQSAERRRREIAVLRALGARGHEVFVLVLLEALLLSTMGVALGWFLGHGGAALGAGYLEGATGLALNPWRTTPAEWAALGTVWAVGVLAGLIPAWRAYRRLPAADLTNG